MVVERTKTGYSAYAEKHPVYTVGSSLEELKKNMLEVLNLHFEKQSKIIIENDIKITLDLPQFFEFYKVINVKLFPNALI
jgi:predicted RNase H-like HicB family nuclease